MFGITPAEQGYNKIILNDHHIKLQHMIIHLIVRLKYNLKLTIYIPNVEELFQLIDKMA